MTPIATAAPMLTSRQHVALRLALAILERPQPAGYSTPPTPLQEIQDVPAMVDLILGTTPTPAPASVT